MTPNPLGIYDHNRIPFALQNPSYAKPFHLLVQECASQFVTIPYAEQNSFANRWEIKFTKETFLSKGAYSQVYSAKQGQLVVKFSDVIDESLAELVAVAYFKKRKIHHCKLLASIKADVVNEQGIGKVNRSFLVYEHGGITVNKLAFAKKPCPLKTILALTFQALEIISKLHHPKEEAEKPHVHGDLKPGNFVYKEETNRLSLIDLASFTQIALCQEQTGDAFISLTPFLTPSSRAPEILFESRPTDIWQWDTRASEVWAVGEIPLALFTQNYFYHHTTSRDYLGLNELHLVHMYYDRMPSPPPAQIIETSLNKKHFFDAKNNLKPPIFPIPKLPSLEDCLQSATVLRLSEFPEEERAENAGYCNQIVDLIRRMKIPDPVQRESAITLLSTFDREQEWLYPTEEKKDDT